MNIAHAEAAADDRGINVLGGDDLVQASGLTADAIGFEADAGDADDVLVGRQCMT